MAPPLQLREKI